MPASVAPPAVPDQEAIAKASLWVAPLRTEIARVLIGQTALVDRLLVALLTNEGLGHTLVIHTRNQDVIRQFCLEKPVNRILINTPAALGGIGATTNITPALTLGCGAVGGGRGAGPRRCCWCAS